jgi:hypothetical protein
LTWVRVRVGRAGLGLAAIPRLRKWVTEIKTS